MAATNAASGPVPAPWSVRCSPSTRSCAVTVEPFSPVVVSCESSCTGASGSRYSPSKAAQISGDGMSVPVSSVIVWIVLENSIWRRRGQVEAVLGLHHVGDAALAALAVHPHDRLVGAADVLRVDGQVRHLPLLVVAVAERLEALLDGVLVAAGERRVDEVADVGVPRVHGQAVAVLGHPPQRVDVGDVELGVDALAEQVHGDVDHVDVAGALAVAEERALHAVGAGHDRRTGPPPRRCPGRCAGAATGRSDRGSARCGGSTR